MISKLIEKIVETGAPICAGLDPSLSFIPAHILAKGYEQAGESLEGAAQAIWLFNREIIDALSDLVPAVKPQIAMYEQFGIPGLYSFVRTVNYAHKKGLLVIGDVKRGDIGSTSASYAAAHIGGVEVGSRKFRPFNEDFCTVNPYLGTDGVEPFTSICREEGRGIFVLCKTSNPSSGEFQDRLIDDRPLYEHVALKINEWGETAMDGDYSEVGCVVGATYPEIGRKLRELMPHAYILVPGYGAQGASGADLKGFFNDDGLGAIVNSSRGIIAAYRKEEYSGFGPEGFAEAARAAVLDMKKDIEENALGNGKI